MLTISQQQSLDRWDAITPQLREALFSEVNADFVSKVCQDEHLPAEKGDEIAGISGYVLLGFMHPEDLAVELKDGVGLDQKTASSIASAINQRIFAPLRQQIDSVYSPLSKFEAGPKIIQEIKPPQAMVMPVTPAPKAAATPIAASAPKPLSQVTSQTAAGFTIGATPSASNKNVAATAPQASQPSSDKGWSNQTQQNPVVKLGVITPSMPSPAAGAGTTNAGANTPATQKPEAAQQPAPQTAKGMSEFERLDMMKEGSTPQAAAAPAQPAPMMLHEVSSPASLQSSPNFRFDLTAQNQINAATPPKAPPAKAAVIEFGNQAASSAPAPAPKVVHYSEYKTPIPAPAPSASAGPREITQITQIGAPKQVTAPPPMPPKPPTQQPAQPGKVIVQDFLGPQK